MATIVKHESKTSRLMVIIFTPLIVLIFAFLVKPFGLAKMMNNPGSGIENYIILILIVWIGAIFLTVADYFSYKGLTGDTGSDSLLETPLKFLTAIKEKDKKLLLSLISSESLKNLQPRLSEWYNELQSVTIATNVDKLKTTDYEIFRVSITKLKSFSMSKDEIGVLIPMVKDNKIPVGAPMLVLVAIMNKNDHRHLVNFDIAKIKRPMILD